MDNYTTLPTTAEEEEAMNAITQASAEVLHNPVAQPDLEQILKTISEQFSLLSTVINQSKAQPNPTPPEMQACVDAVLEQAGWVGEKLDKAVVEYMENEIDIADECNDKISESVNNYFSYEFTLTDHCDIDDIVADKVDDRLEEMVNERLQEMLSTATITFNN
jgi:DNA polymerase III alpha subunit